LAIPDPHPTLRATFSRGEKDIKSTQHRLRRCRRRQVGQGARSTASRNRIADRKECRNAEQQRRFADGLGAMDRVFAVRFVLEQVVV